jgi:hypothetical protein
MEWLAVKTGALLNSSAAILDQAVQYSSQFEATLSPAAMKVVQGGMSLATGHCSRRTTSAS